MENQFTVGDQVAVYKSSLGHYAVFRIAKISPKSGIITLANGTRYRADGSEITDDKWSATSIDPVTPEIRTRILRSRNIHTLREMNWEALDSETLMKMVAFLKQQQS